MKFRTRLWVTFAIIVIIPLVLTVAAFLIIGTFLMRSQRLNGFNEIDYSTMSESMETVGAQTQALYEKLLLQLEANPAAFEDTEYLESVADSINKKTSYILVRKGGEIFYTGNSYATEQIWDRLPPYGQNGTESRTGYYFSELQKYVKQLDFVFSDGTQGSLFIITRVNSLISRRLLVDMVVAIVAVLVFTSFLLTLWIHRGVFDPINQLNIAMRKIKDGNFDYRLSNDSKGEIGDLYRNYEDMRLRLKESAEEKLQQENQNRELISNISHDLKTPITAIKGYVEGIMDGVADTPEKMDKYIKTVYNKANDMDRLINELTIYSGIDNNRIPYHFHRINVADYFGDCVEEVGLELESKNIELNYSNLVSPDTVIIADPEQMKRVISNIISNSIKYMDKAKGIIDIRILDEVDAIRIEIEDNGKGIAAKDLSNIFERFYRTDASRNSSTGGNGIGLSIVKKIVEDHGGYIWATSKEEEGTCMHFVIRKYKELNRSMEL
ncbi:MAG: HAMP domain-containing histidine kinase [Lachnospiraceae bacterium]|nr:HAMP domain-containing histidine kinase [Lachnospiraceae bacterium]